MQPWYIATKRFGPWDGETWRKYAAWAGLGGLRELVTLDATLCPTLLPDIKPDYWPHIVNEDFMLAFFTDLDFLRAQIAAVPDRNLLCVYRNPTEDPAAPDGPMRFDFVGYDVVDVHGDVSALANCGGFPDVFANDELLPFGLLPTRERAAEVQAALKQRHPGHSHTDCHIWAVFRAAAG